MRPPPGSSALSAHSTMYFGSTERMRALAASDTKPWKATSEALKLSSRRFCATAKMAKRRLAPCLGHP